MKIVRKVLDKSVTILEITGSVVLGKSAEELTSELSTLLSDNAVQAVILNMENINYIDSTGLGEVVGHLNSYREAGKRLRLVKPNETIVKLMELTRLDQLVKIYPSEEEALEDILK